MYSYYIHFLCRIVFFLRFMSCLKYYIDFDTYFFIHTILTYSYIDFMFILFFILYFLLYFNYFYHIVFVSYLALSGNHDLLPILFIVKIKTVKRISPNSFGLVIVSFGLNSLGQKSFDLNGSRKLRT